VEPSQSLTSLGHNLTGTQDRILILLGAAHWLLGGLEGRTWDHLLLGVPAIAVGTAVIAAHGRDLDALLLGEVGAQSVGVDVPRVRMRLVLACALVVGAAVAVAGPIGFVGLLVPHLLRLAAAGRPWNSPGAAPVTVQDCSA
jgi:ABC-type Fe3+-siderophore transport system permease subunit